MEEPKVVVGIVTYNRSNLLSKSIDSILEQQYSNLLIVVFDNASSDDTQQVLKSYSTIINYKSEDRVNIVDAKNHLMSTYDGDYFMGIDDDAWTLQNDIISTSVDFLEKNKDVAAIGLDILTPHNHQSVFQQKVPFQKGNFVGCGCVLRKTAIKTVNYYSKTIGYYGAEEEDLSLKLMNEGFKIIAYPGLFVWHEMTITARSLNKQWRSQVSNSLVLILKYYPFLLALIVLPYKILIFCFYSIRKGLFFQFLVGVVDFLFNLREIFYQRKPMPYKLLIKFHRLLRE
jgi:GT2 family glycosyltransferase